MELQITGPTERRQVQVAWIEFNGTSGNFVIQRGHAPMVLTIAPNSSVIFRLTTGKQEVYRVAKGVVHVTRTGVTLIVVQ